MLQFSFNDCRCNQSASLLVKVGSVSKLGLLAQDLW